MSKDNTGASDPHLVKTMFSLYAQTNKHLGVRSFSLSFFVLIMLT